MTSPPTLNLKKNPVNQLIKTNTCKDEYNIGEKDLLLSCELIAVISVTDETSTKAFANK